MSDLLAMSVDAVVIASSSYAHAEHVTAAARAGVAVFVEKPLATTPADTAAVAATVQDAGIAVQVGFQRRHDRRYQSLRDAVVRRRVGDPVLVKCFGCDPAPPRTPSVGPFGNGGLFLNSAIHDFDAVRYLVGLEVTAVAAAGGLIFPERSETPADIDVCASSLHLDGGIRALSDWHRFSPDGLRAGVEVIGTEASLRVSLPRQRGRFASKDAAPTVIEAFFNAYSRSIDAFIAAVRLDHEPIPSLTDAVRAAEIAFAARASFEAGGELTPITRLNGFDETGSTHALG
jgi:predicted dehydrogenase